MGTAQVNDITLGYDDTEGPEGPPLLLVHGHPFDRTMWRPQLRAFGLRRVIAPDLRGYGRSTVVPGTSPLEAFAGDLAAFLDHLGVDRAVVCGLSMGGQIALEFHRLFADRVAGLVLADTFAQAETEQGRAERHDRAAQLEREGMTAYSYEVLESMVGPATLREVPAVADHVLGMMLAAPPAGAAAALRGRAERPDYTDMLAEIAVPTLVVVGREDAFTPVGDAEFLHARIPGARLTVVEGAGHMPNLERPTVFNAAVAALLADVIEDAAVPEDTVAAEDAAAPEDTAEGAADAPRTADATV